jgi:hypothetical protein
MLRYKKQIEKIMKNELNNNNDEINFKHKRFRWNLELENDL